MKCRIRNALFLMIMGIAMILDGLILVLTLGLLRPTLTPSWVEPSTRRTKDSLIQHLNRKGIDSELILFDDHE